MARKNNALGFVFKIAKEAEKQHRKAMREAEKQQRQKERLQAKLEREKIKLQKEDIRRQIFEEKAKLNREKQEMKIRMQHEKSLYNEMVESSISEENKEEIKSLKDIVNRFYLDWLQKIN